MRKSKNFESILRRFISHPRLRSKIKGRTVGLFLVPDGEMRAMKKRFLPKEKGPANVLAFPEPKNWPRQGNKKQSLGEIYLNRKYAKGDGAPTLLLHGLLHLLGYDHKKKDDRLKMEKLERKVMRQCLPNM